MRLRGLQSRQLLATTGTLAILYCIVVLTYVATSPDLRIRCLLLDSTRPAGLPDVVVSRAEEVLGALEQVEQSADLSRLADDLPLFAVSPTPQPKPATTSAVEERLKEIIPDELSPREALELIYKLKEAAKS